MGLEVPSPQVREAAAGALGELAKVSRSPKAAEPLRERLKDGHPLVRKAAAKALGKCVDLGGKFADDICMLFEDKVAYVQVAAVEAVGELGAIGKLYAATIARLLNSDHPTVTRIAAVRVLGNMDERGAAFTEEIADLLQDP